MPWRHGTESWYNCTHSWLGHTTEVRRRASRPGRCVIWETAAAYRMKWIASGAYLDTLEDRKIFAPAKNHPQYSIFAKPIELTEVPLSDRHRWEKQILKESICYFMRKHTILFFIFIVYAIYLICKYPCFKVKSIKYSEPLATSVV